MHEVSVCLYLCVYAYTCIYVYVGPTAYVYAYSSVCEKFWQIKID